MHVLLLHRLVRDVIDLAPALVGADEIGLDRDRPRALRRDDVHHVVLHHVAQVRGHRARAGIDLRHLVRGAVLEVRIRLPRLAEERRLRDHVLIGVEHDELRPRLLRLEIPRHLARALVRTGRAPVGDGRHAHHEHAAVGDRLQLVGERHRLRPGLPRVEHAVARLAQPFDLFVLELDARRHDELVVLERALAHAHALRRWLDRARRLVNDPHAVAAQAGVAERHAVDRAHAAQHEVAERAGDELLVGLEEDDLDRRITEPHVLRRGGAPPAAADHDDTLARLRREVALRRRRAPAERADGDANSCGPEKLSACDAHTFPPVRGWMASAAGGRRPVGAEYGTVSVIVA